MLGVVVQPWEEPQGMMGVAVHTQQGMLGVVVPPQHSRDGASEIIYESYLHTIFLTTLIFLLTIGYARKHLVHHCSYNSKAGICIS